MCYGLKENMEVPFIVEAKGNIISISDSFLELIGYSYEEVVNESFDSIWNKLFRGIIKPGDDYCGNEVHLFTKALEFRCVSIKKYENSKSKNIMYIIKETEDIRFENKNLYFEQIFKANINGMGVYSVPDMTLLKVNQMYLDYMKKAFKQKDEVIGKNIYEVIDGYKGSSLEKFKSEAVDSEKPILVEENEYHYGKNKVCYWDCLITPIKENGRVKYIVTSILDSTERVQNRKKIKEQMEHINTKNKQLEAIFESIQDKILVFDRDGNHLQKSNSFTHKLLDRAEGNVCDSAKDHIFLDMDGRKIPLEELVHAKVMRGEKVKNFRVNYKMGEAHKHFIFNGIPVFDEKGEFNMGIMFCTDITETVDLSNMIKQQRDLLESILDNMQEAILVFDKNGKHVITNKSSRRQFLPNSNSSANKSKGARFYNLEGKEVDIDHAIMEYLKYKKPVKDRIMISKFNKKTKYICVNATPLFDIEGNLLCGIICSRDVTEMIENQKVLEETQRKLLEAEMEKNDTLLKAIEVKDEFLSIISHEFRTPLNVIDSAIQALFYVCGDELSDKARKYLKMIRQNMYRQIRLVNNLLDITRANAGSIKLHKKNIDIVFLSKVITESVCNYALQKGVTVAFEASIQDKIIGIDDEKYERILLNLLSNAIKFTPEGKTIKVKISSHDKNICVEVIDEGIGIPEDKVDLIFERFGQVDSSLSRKAEGAGIGLSLVRRFVEALEGSISVRSEVNSGSTFTILLPDQTVLNGNQVQEVCENKFVQLTTVELSDIYL